MKMKKIQNPLRRSQVYQRSATMIRDSPKKPERPERPERPDRIAHKALLQHKDYNNNKQEYK